MRVTSKLDLPVSFTKEHFPLVDKFISVLKSYESNKYCEVKSMIRLKGVKDKEKIIVDDGFKKLSITLSLNH